MRHMITVEALHPFGATTTKVALCAGKREHSAASFKHYMLHQSKLTACASYKQNPHSNPFANPFCVVCIKTATALEQQKWRERDDNFKSETAQQTTSQEGCGDACSFSTSVVLCEDEEVICFFLLHCHSTPSTANVVAPKSRATSILLPPIWVRVADMRRSRSSPSPLLRTRRSIDEDNETKETQADNNDRNLGGIDSEALWKTAVEVIRGVSNSLSQEEEQAKTNTRRRESPQPYECDEEESFSQGMRNLLLSLEKNFESEVTTKQSNTSNNAVQDPVVSVLQKSLSLSKTQKKKKKRYFRSTRQPSNDFYSRLPDIDEDMSLHVTPSLEEEFHPPMMDASTDSSSSDDQRLRFIEAELPPQEEGDSSWKKQVRVQSQLPNVEVLLLRRASSLARVGSLRSTHSLTPSIRSYCTSHDGSSSCYSEYEDDEDDFSAFTRLHSFNSLQTSTSTSAHSYAFQEVDEEEDIFADCSSFSWFGK